MIAEASFLTQLHPAAQVAFIIGFFAVIIATIITR